MGPNGKKRRDVLKAAAAAGMVSTTWTLAGCIGDDDGDTPTPTPSPTETPGGTPTPTETPRFADDQSLHITQQVEPAHDYDPIVVNDAYTARIVNHIFDGLYEFGEAFDLHPNLAVGEPEVERDGTRYIIEIVDNAEFHNGDPVTADDVLHSFIAPVVEQTDNIDEVDMVDTEASTTIDEHTVQLDLEFSYAPFGTSTIARNIVNKQARLDALGLTEDEWWEHDFEEEPLWEDSSYNKENPIGSGPFVYVDHVSGDFTDIERWDDYWGDVEPHIESVRWVSTEDDAARTAQIRSADTDFITGIAPPDWEVLEDDDAVDVYSTLSVSYFYLAFNCNEGPTTDPDVRNGIAHAFSMTAFVEDIIGPAGANAISPLPESLLETWDLPMDEYAAMENEYDPETASDLLSGNVPDGWDPIFMAPPDDIREALCERAASRLEEVPGVDIQPRVQRVDWTPFLERYSTGSTDDYTMYALGWTGGPDPDVYFYPLFHESSAGVNQGHFYESDTDFHDWIADARENPDLDTRRDLYDNATREILEQKVHIPGYNLRNSIGAQPHVRDLEVHPDSGTKPRLVSDHHNVYLAPQ